MSGQAGKETQQPADRGGSAPLALLLAGVAGYVDALGALLLSGLFVAFMSGNTTTAGSSAAGGAWAQAGRAALPIALFVVGGALGSAWLRLRPRALPLVYAVMGALLALFPLLTPAGARAPALPVSLLLLTVPMGMLNATLRHVGTVSVGLTYVTGTLASVGEALGALLSGGDRRKAAAELRLRGGLWAAFLAGAALSGLLTPRSGAAASLLPAAVLLLVGLRRWWTRVRQN